MASSEERMRILRMIQGGQVTPEEGARLLDALGGDSAPARAAAVPPRSLRVRVTDLATRRLKINVTVPVSLIDVGLKLGARLIPREHSEAIADVMRAVERGSSGRIFEMHDLEEGEQIEIFVDVERIP